MTTWVCMLYYPPSLLGASIAIARPCNGQCVRNSFAKRLFSILHPGQFCTVCGNCAPMNIGECTEIALCARLAYCNKSTQIIRCFSKQPPHNCFRYLLHDLLDPTHSTALQTTLLNVVRCSTLPHNQMWFDVAAEVNVGSLRVLSDHIADHTGPDRGAK